MFDIAAIGFPARLVRSPKLIIAVREGFRWWSVEVLPIDRDHESQSGLVGFYPAALVSGRTCGCSRFNVDDRFGRRRCPSERQN
jgi:hypothetical protein